MDPLVTAAWLCEHLHDENLAIVDCRFTLLDPSGGEAAYQSAHIPGAVYFHLDRDLAGPVGEHGGRHPLPDADTFAGKLGAAGITDGVTVVAYDQNGDMAPRLWWLLRYFGHDQVAVLDGGIHAFVAAGGKLTADRSQPKATRFTPHPRPQMVVDRAAVKSRPAGTVLLDARSHERFLGAVQQMDPVPGHIPGAVSAFWHDSVREDGTWKSPDEQRQRFAGLVGDKAAIASCGSGVTACGDLLALALTGRWDVPLYVGSYSDWISYPDSEIERGEGS